MTHKGKLIISILAVVMLTLSSCTLIQAPQPTPVPPTDTPAAQPTPTLQPFPTEMPTATEQPTEPTVTDTPAPFITTTFTPTSIPPTSTKLPPTPTYSGGAVGPEAGFSCDIIDNVPSDNTKIRSGADFDIKWTIINNGASKWRDNTVLKYQTGPKMTTVTKIVLPKLKPDETYTVVLDGNTTGKSGSTKVMVWAVIGPDKNGEATYWMCYPYTRIIIK